MRDPSRSVSHGLSFGGRGSLFQSSLVRTHVLACESASGRTNERTGERASEQGAERKRTRVYTLALALAIALALACACSHEHLRRARAYTLLGVVYSSSFILPCGGSRGLSRARAERARGLGAMTSIFYPLLISMLPPPLSPPPDLPPHPPPSSPTFRSVISIPRPRPAPSTHFVLSAATLPLPVPSSSPHLGHPFCGKTCMCIGHIREGITIFSCRTTLAPRRPRPANSPRLPTAASDHLPQSPTLSLASSVHFFVEPFFVARPSSTPT